MHRFKTVARLRRPRTRAASRWLPRLDDGTLTSFQRRNSKLKSSPAELGELPMLSDIRRLLFDDARFWSPLALLAAPASWAGDGLSGLYAMRWPQQTAANPIPASWRSRPGPCLRYRAGGAAAARPRTASACVLNHVLGVAYWPDNEALDQRAGRGGLPHRRRHAATASGCRRRVYDRGRARGAQRRGRTWTGRYEITLGRNPWRRSHYAGHVNLERTGDHVTVQLAPDVGSVRRQRHQDRQRAGGGLWPTPMPRRSPPIAPTAGSWRARGGRDRPAWRRSLAPVAAQAMPRQGPIAGGSAGHRRACRRPSGRSVPHADRSPTGSVQLSLSS